MNAEDPSELRLKRSRRWVVVFLIVASMLIARSILAPTSYTRRLPLHFLHEVPVGWWGFVKRTVPQIQLEPSAIVLALLSLLIAVALTHTVGRRFSRAWSWRSSIAASIAPFLLFAITVSAGGTQMRIAQLLTDKRPIVENSRAYFAWVSIELEMKERIRKAATTSPKQ